MKIFFYTTLISFCMVLFEACENEITETKVRKAAMHSNEMNHEYVKNQREMYVKTLENRIKMLEDDLKKIRDVSAEGRKGTDIETSVQQLAAEKALLEGSLRTLHEKTELAEKQIDAHFNKYNRALDSMLKDLNNFTESYKAENSKP